MYITESRKTCGSRIDCRICFELSLLFSHSVMPDSLWPHGLHHDLFDRGGVEDRILRFTHANFIMIFLMLFLLQHACFRWSAPWTAAMGAVVGSPCMQEVSYDTFLSPKMPLAALRWKLQEEWNSEWPPLASTWLIRDVTVRLPLELKT